MQELRGATRNEDTVQTAGEKTNEVDNPIPGTSRNIPSPFKNTLFWPLSEDDKGKRRKREKLPAVVTSPQMVKYFKKKEEAKNAKNFEKEKRKVERERKKNEKEQVIAKHKRITRQSSVKKCN